MSDRSRVLLLDDVPEDRKAAVRVLEGLAEVVVVHSEDELEAALATGPVDAMVTEVTLAWATGFEAAARVRARWPHCACVMLTTSAIERVVIEAKSHGFIDYLLKTRRGYNALASAVAAAVERARAPIPDPVPRNAEDEALAAQLIRAMPGIVYVFDVATGGVTFLSDRVWKVLGYSPGDVQAMGRDVVSRLIHPDDVARWREVLASARPDGGLDDEREGEYRVRHADGRWRVLHTRELVIERRDGEPQKVLGIAWDVTTEHAHAEQTRIQIAALHVAPTGIVITDRDGVIQWVNPAFTGVTGYTLEEAVGRKPSILKSGAQDDVFYTNMWRTLVSGKPWRGVIVNRRKDGSQYLQDMTAIGVADAKGHITHFVAQWHDVTEKVAADAALRDSERRLEDKDAEFIQAQKMEAVGLLAGGVAHDFNNMLTVILGSSAMLLETLVEGDPRREEALAIHNTGVRAAALTRQLLAFSRRQVFETTVVDLNDVVRGFERMLRRMLKEHVRIEVLTSADPLPVCVDAGQIEQVLANLAVNAADAMPDGGTLTIRVARESGDEDEPGSHAAAVPGARARLSVSDTGSGMTAEVQQRVFEPFFTTKSAGHGTGLGLSMVFGVIKQSGGHIWVESAPGRGATFHINLPIALAATHEPAAAATERPARPRATVLVVEDEPSVRKLVTRELENAGYRVIAAENAQQAVLLSGRDETRPDVLLTDVVMPDTDGAALAAALRDRHPALKVVLMSGYSDSSTHRLITCVDGARFIAKPFGPGALVAKIAEVLA